MLNKEQYITVKNTWKQEKEHTVHEHVLYNILRGLSTDYGFIEIKHMGRLNANMNDPWRAYNLTVDELAYALNSKRHNYEATIACYAKVFGIEFTEEIVSFIQKALNRK